MKKLVSLVLAISILFSFNSSAEGIIWGSNHYSTTYNNGSNFSDPFYIGFCKTIKSLDQWM